MTAADASRREARWRALAIVGVYCVVSILWIALSDRVLETLADSKQELSALQTYKGWMFVALSALLFYGLSLHALRGLTEVAGRLVDERRRYQQLFDANPHPMWVHDRETLAFLAVNDAAIAHYGYSEGEFLGMTIRDIRPPEDASAAGADVARAGGGRDEAGVWRHRRKDGTQIDVEISSHAVEFAGRPAQMVLAHDVTDRLRSRRALAESEARLRLALAAANQGTYDLDVRTGEAVVSDSYAAMLGYPPGSLRVTFSSWLGDMHPDDRERVLAAYGGFVAGQLPEYRLEYRHRTRDGGWKWILALGSVVERDADGAPLRILGTNTDITREKRNEQRIRQLARMYAALTEANQAILGAGDRSALFGEVCRIAVEQGGLRMAWIGLVDAATRHVVPAASYGQGRLYAELVGASADASVPQGRGPTGEAIRSGRPVVVNDFLADPRTAHWREAAAAEGFAASGAFPIHQDGEVGAVLNLYASEPGYFNDEVTSLTEELARDVSIALERRALQEALSRNRDLLRAIVEGTSDAVFAKDLQGRYLLFNSAACRLLGRRPEEVIGRGDEALFPPDRARTIAAQDASVLERGETVTYEETLPTAAGAGTTFLTTKGPLRDAAGRVIGVFGIARDVTERKRMERLLRERADAP